ncbi:VWA domain-containing protein [Paraliomyxa miuraensis]|uniref:VWA domain-containing protein n=1 Tax=Paraliomyxa miuraensis TaxID=376150 RepID=UPI00224F46E0|nr:VWA domain-containing protein [Paraliomyxa miuraensis]MCX4243355.1 VWA domain-containing protein [Paraliomyxa miuraensis]
MMNARWRLGLTAALLTACGGEGSRADGDQSGSGITVLATDSATMGVGTADETGPKLDVPAAMDLLGEEECAAVDAQAELVPLPADIIFVVDNSGSMDYEAQQIQQEMNGFSSQIIGSGIDVHVVLVSSYPNQGNGICIPAPLGNGGCPGSDTNPPIFTHVDRQVGSHDAWEALLETHPQWAPAFREESSKHVVVVTDDTSNMDWQDFDAQFRALDPSYEGYIHHSVVCHSDCPDAAGIGTNYIQLSMMTGGVASDLCDQDFQTVFDALSTEVIGGTELACEFPIPPPPDDMEFNPDQVNVEFDDGMGNVLQIGRVDSAADCPNVVDGWHYDDPVSPTLIVVCPQTCTKLQSSENGTVNIAFGCASMPAG